MNSLVSVLGAAACAALRVGVEIGRRLCELFAGATLALIASSAAGQEGPVAFEFSFSNPGARSMGLGGAFSALADDATAAFANPAGLVQLIEPELSVEGRSWSYDTPFVQGGRASGSPTGLGIDTVSGLRIGDSSSQSTGVSFASFVYPSKKWSLALYRHTWAEFELTSQVDGLFGLIDGELERSETLRAKTKVKVVNTGLSGGYELTDRLSVGLGVVYYEAKMDSFSMEFIQAEDAFFAANPFLLELLDTTYSYQAENSGTSVHAGILWSASPRWSFGGYFREGPRLSLHVVETVGPADEERPAGYIDLDTRTPLHLPDVYGLGVAYRTEDGAWTIAFEWTRVEYSSITNDLNGHVFDPAQVQIPDGDELHLGLEYVVVRSKPIVVLRLGTWLDPGHSVGPGPDADFFERAILSGGDDEIHLAGGVGLVLERFQIDLAADLSDIADLASLSLVYRF